MTTLKETLVYCEQLINENIDALILNANTSNYGEALVTLKKELKTITTTYIILKS